MPKTKSKTSIVYKLTSPGFTSYCMDGPCRRKYEIGKKTLPKVGKLFAFRTLEDAKAFGGDYPIFVCKAKLATDQERAGNTIFGSEEWLKIVWEKQNLVLVKEIYPPGTVLCDWIEPIELIQINNES